MPLVFVQSQALGESAIWIALLNGFLDELLKNELCSLAGRLGDFGDLDGLLIEISQMVVQGGHYHADGQER